MPMDAIQRGTNRRKQYIMKAITQWNNTHMGGGGG